MIPFVRSRTEMRFVNKLGSSEECFIHLITRARFPLRCSFSFPSGLCRHAGRFIFSVNALRWRIIGSLLMCFCISFQSPILKLMTNCADVASPVDQSPETGALHASTEYQPSALDILARPSRTKNESVNIFSTVCAKDFGLLTSIPIDTWPAFLSTRYISSMCFVCSAVTCSSVISVTSSGRMSSPNCSRALRWDNFRSLGLTSKSPCIQEYEGALSKYLDTC
mmetsp:Transcript_6202/g.38549  ORF Transcript_6202/g.38549 Transcript_6202/m.38549 type:complete len:223 (-) Transcript_6202:515-1183(-)